MESELERLGWSWRRPCATTRLELEEREEEKGKTVQLQGDKAGGWLRAKTCVTCGTRMAGGDARSAPSRDACAASSTGLTGQTSSAQVKVKPKMLN